MKKILFCTAGITLLMACSKNEATPPPDEKPPIVKFLNWYGIQENGVRSGISLTYNAQNLLTALTPDDEDDTNIRMAYDAAGNLVMSEVWTEDVLSRLFVHYVNGKPDTAVERFYLRATNENYTTNFIEYTLANDRVTRILMKDSAGAYPDSEILVRYQGENVSSLLARPVGQPTDTTQYVEWAYGTKRNPFTASKMKYYVAPTGNSLYYQSANEPLTQLVKMPDLGVTHREKYVYAYDADGYPVRQAGIFDGETDSTIVQYQYRP